MALSDIEWIRQSLAHRDAHAVPYNVMFSPPALSQAQDHYGDDLDDALSLPLRMTGPKSIKPLYASPDECGPTIVDEFGVTWSTSPIDRGCPVGPCLHEPDLTGYRFPDPTRDYRFEDIGAWCREQEGHYRIVWVGDLWERATFMRGMEHLLIDVLVNRRFVEELLQELADYILRTMQILFARFEFEGIAISDDYGAQKDLVMSPQHWRGLIRPLLADLYALAKQHDRTVFHHSCGNVTSIIGDMIDIGLDVLHPIQPEAMDIYGLKAAFGDNVTFCGGIPTQNLLVSGSPDQVRTEVRRLKRDMGRGGGYILEPGITLQADVPLDNIVAMIEEARIPGR